MALGQGERVEVGSRDELGALARIFNLMSERIGATLAGLRKSESKRRGIYENALEGIFRTSVPGRLLRANPSLARILGYDSPEELVSSHTDVRSQRYVRGSERDEFLAALRAEGAAIGKEVFLRRKDCSGIWVSLSARAIPDAAGEVAFIDGFIADIDALKKAEGDGRASSALERCRARVLSMALVHESLYRSRDFRHVDFGAIASELAAALRSDREHPGREAAEIAVDLGDPSLPVDAALPLALALGECVSNSLEHAFPPGWEGPRKVSISGGREGSRCAITIADGGVGLPAGFDPEAGGSLGMRIAAAAMSQVGGRLAPGPGATMRLEFELPGL